MSKMQGDDIQPQKSIKMFKYKIPGFVNKVECPNVSTTPGNFINLLAIVISLEITEMIQILSLGKKVILTCLYSIRLLTVIWVWQLFHFEFQKF